MILTSTCYESHHNFHFACGLVFGEYYIHHSDQGIQYAATAYVDLLRVNEIAISMAKIGAAWQNGFAERLMRTIKEEEVNLSEYLGYHDAYDHLGRFLDEVYM